MDDDTIRGLLTRLARADPSGGTVIERAAILAAGTDVRAVLDWIDAHGGTPEVAPDVASPGGLHGPRSGGRSAARPPSRFVLPAGALD